jgi:hypothetical protein
MKTHYDRITAYLGEALPAAQEAIDKAGLVRAAEAVSAFVANKAASPVERSKLLASFIVQATIHTARRAKNPLNFRELIGDSTFSTALAALTSSKEWLTIAVATAKHWAWYELYGRNTYEISPGLAQQLRDTELRGLKTDDLRLPYTSIYLTIPPEAGLRSMSPGDADLFIDGIYITEDERTYGERTWHFLVVSERPGNPGDDSLSSFFRVKLPEGKPLDEALDATQEMMDSDPYEGRDDTSVLRREWRGVFKWAMNAVLYATHGEDRDVLWISKEAQTLTEQMQKHPKGSNKRERLREKLRGLDTRRVTYLGRGLKVEQEGDETGTGQPLTVYGMVQGHWKRQFHGPARSLRKLIWIRPYPRGPEDGPLSNVIHKLT